MKLSIALTLLHLIVLYEYIHLQVTNLQSHRLKLFGALQIHGLFDTAHLDSYLMIHHDIERENTPKAMLIYRQRTALFKQMDDAQIVSSLFGAPVFTSSGSLGAQTETFERYFMNYLATVSDTSTAKVNLSLSTAEGVQPIKLSLSQFDKNLRSSTFILKITKKRQPRPQLVVEPREGS